MLQIAIWCLIVSAALAYINYRFIGLPASVGVMTIALAISVALIGLDLLGWSAPRDYEAAMMASVDFPGLLMRGMLALLLFAGGLQIEVERLRLYRWPIGVLAVFGTTVTALLVGIALWKLLPTVNIPLSLGYCLVFGALISPTDAVAVSGVLKSADAPKQLEAIISGESLFNDGVGVVLFSLAMSIVETDRQPDLREGLLLLLREGGGGVLLGLLLGQLLFRLLREVQNYQVEVLLTLAVVMGGYELAYRLGVSGPLAMVLAGLAVGTRSRSGALPDATRDHLERFWDLIDGILNTVLFVLIGLEVVRVSFSFGILLAAALTIAIILGARAVSVATPLSLMGRMLELPSGSWRLLTWAGLRGGISVALALSLPPGHGREVVLALTYCVVVFSILAQGLTIERIARRAIGSVHAGGPARA